jgi:putative transposase
MKRAPKGPQGLRPLDRQTDRNETRAEPQNAWSEFVPFLDWDVEIRRVVCSTNAIESLNARYRRAVRARGHFPNDAAALKCLYLVTRSLDPTGRGRARWATRWKPALNAFAIAFEGRIN